MLRTLAPALALLLLAGCSSNQTRITGCSTFPKHAQPNTEVDILLEQSKIEGTLNAWHTAASIGDFDRYFRSMTHDSIFLGTDATERWTKPQFMDYAREPFADGHGWTYNPSQRHITVAHDGKTAWSDELLTHDRYGTLRGTSVLVNINKHWKIAQYNLTFLVPNPIAKEVVELISTHPVSSSDTSH
tara:strand:- start:10781 stop:11341 length:561 start_codon:yes stop_codon:yes gene_type:complete